MKSVEIAPLPNAARHAWVKWDAFIHCAEPGLLATELADRACAFRLQLGETEDGLIGFEVEDPDGYVLFFGRPL